MRSLSKAGFKGDFVRSAVLPDWWDDDTCATDPGLLPEIELRVARFLGVPVSAVRDAPGAIVAPQYAGAQLRRVRDISRDRLGPAIHAALQIAGAVVRSMSESKRTPAVVPPSDGLVWREAIERSGTVVTLEDVVGDLWTRGIPVVPLDVLPSPSFQGLACVVEDRPVVVLGHRHDEPGRVQFLVAHEAGHIAAGDCSPEHPVVDEDEEILDSSEMERNADRFATHLLVGRDDVPAVDGGDFKQLAKNAKALERTTGANASSIIFAWARQSGDYAMASMAVRALYQHRGARNLLRTHFDRHVDIDAAAESDRALLKCVYGDPERHEAGS